MPRIGLAGPALTTAAADLADEVGYQQLTMGLLAERLGIRTPSLYKHVNGLADLQHRIATLAMTELGDRLTDAIGGRSGRDALAAFATAFRDYVIGHPGRYTATIGAKVAGPDDPLLAASARVLATTAAVLRGYGVPPEQTDHALRTLRSMFHGFATLQAAHGFQWAADTDDSFQWLIDFVDRGLRDRRSPQTPGDRT
jgi:AcrR family transcriptional regulator